MTVMKDILDLKIFSKRFILKYLKEKIETYALEDIL